MKVFQSVAEAHATIPTLVYAIGNFDGVHLGHEGLIKCARDVASRLQVGFGVLTFWPHPRSLLRASSDFKLITDREQRRNRFEELGVPFVIEQPFTDEFSRMSAEDFCVEVLVYQLKARAIVTGENFRFGHKATGTPGDMAKWLARFGVDHALAPPVYVRGELCSSSRIRSFLLKGDIESACQLLGRPFTTRSL